MHPFVKANYKTSLRHAIAISDLSDERRQVIERMINTRPKEFKRALREFMREKEIHYLESRLVDVKQKVEDLKKLSYGLKLLL